MIGRAAHLRRWAASHLGAGKPPRPGVRPPTNLAPIATAIAYAETTSAFHQRLVYERLMARHVALSARRDLKTPAYLHVDARERFPRVAVTRVTAGRGAPLRPVPRSSRRREGPRPSPQALPPPPLRLRLRARSRASPSASAASMPRCGAARRPASLAFPRTHTAPSPPRPPPCWPDRSRVLPSWPKSFRPGSSRSRAPPASWPRRGHQGPRALSGARGRGLRGGRRRAQQRRLTTRGRARGGRRSAAPGTAARRRRVALVVAPRAPADGRLPRRRTAGRGRVSGRRACVIS